MKTHGYPPGMPERFQSQPQGKTHTGWPEHNPAEALVRVQIAALDDIGENYLPALFNPATLSVDISVDVGKLHPPGASHATIQYGYTDSPTIPLELYFSTQLLMRRNAPLDINYYVGFFSSFCYGTEAGKAPSPMLFVWPNTLEMVLVVEHFRADYVRFYQDDLRPSAVRVALDTTELRYTYRGSADQRNHAFNRVDPMIRKAGNTGAPMNLKGKSNG